MEDIFEDYLEKEAEPSGGGGYKQIALTANSYKNVDHSLKDEDTNSELATYGDALLNLACCKILFEEKVNNITEGKKVYVSDKSLVEIVAKHYDLLNLYALTKEMRKFQKIMTISNRPKKGTTLHTNTLPQQ